MLPYLGMMHCDSSSPLQTSPANINYVNELNARSEPNFLLRLCNQHVRLSDLEELGSMLWNRDVCLTIKDSLALTPRKLFTARSAETKLWIHFNSILASSFEFYFAFWFIGKDLIQKCIWVRAASGQETENETSDH